MELSFGVNKSLRYRVISAQMGSAIFF